MNQTTDRPGLVAGHAATCRCSTCTLLRLRPPSGWGEAAQPSRAWTWRHWTGVGAALAAIGFALGLASTGNGGIVVGFWILAIIGGAYFLPTIVASSRKHHNLGAVAVVNVFLGWTFVGWVVALAMAASAIRTEAR